mmetsp:Transcript_20609/g.52594  ORF Transcript_20609/g.52594 Transcript_20609/m.52594 type:complete len:285 (+) Transcript_20609:90-944(+)
MAAAGAHRPVDPFYGRPTEVLSHAKDPFWGLPTSAVDWCEPNYAHTRYVAELFNTLSSVPMVVVSLHGLWLCHRYKLEPRFYLCWAGLGVVGLGSLSFHGTLTHFGQALDELSMIVASMAFVYVVLEAGHPEARHPWLPFVEGAYSVAFAIAYLTSPFFFPFFIVAYGATVLLIIHQAYRVYLLYQKEGTIAGKWQRTLFWIAAAGYPGGFLLFWVPENALCPLYPELFRMLNFHAIFHIVTTISPYCYVVFMTYHRCVVLRRRAEHRSGIAGMPYVHVMGGAP